MPAMTRGKSQILYRFTPKSLFRFNETNAWCEVTSIEMRQTKPLSPALGEALRHLLKSWNAIQPDNFPDPVLSPNKYEVGEPYQVHYTLNPLVLICRECKRVQWYRDVDRLVAANYQMTCRGCKQQGTLTQIPYMFIHECGHADSLFIPKHDTSHTIRMVDRGNFRESFWFCDTCNKPLTAPGKQGLGYRRCSSCGKVMRGTTLQDPAIHFTHTLSLVDTGDKLLESADENTTLGESLLAGLVRLPTYRREDIKDLLTVAPPDAEAQAKAEEMRKILALSITDPQQLEATIQQLTTAVISPQAAKQQILRKEMHTLIGEQSHLIPKARASRQLREYLYVRDHAVLQSTTLTALLQQAQERKDTLSQARYTADERTAADLGITNLQLIEAFPLLLASVGFSRFKGQPAEGIKLRPFIAERSKIPIYAVPSTTEALMFELDPWQEAAWLIENTFTTPPASPLHTKDQVRLWLLQQHQHFLAEHDTEERQAPRNDREAHLFLLPWEQERALALADRVAAVSFGLLHSLSHMLINAAIAQVGFEADSLSEYLFPVAGAGVLFASGHQQFTLGGIVSAFQLNLGYWLNSAFEAAQRCMYDPLCTTHGGACHACSYLRFSCQHFNRTVSRSFLVGGLVEGIADRPVIGYWSPQVRARAATLRPAAT